MTTGTGIPPALAAADAQFLNELAQQLRADSIRCSTAAGSGHPTSARQCAVDGLPGSGAPDELMEAAGISASRIATTARELVED